MLFSAGSGTSYGYIQLQSDIPTFFAPGNTNKGNFGECLAGQWYHFALIADGTNLYCFKDGVLITITYTNNLINSSLLRIGRYSASGYYLNGYIDEFRVSKGIARWTEDFTPPTEEYAPGGTPTADRQEKKLCAVNLNPKN